MSYMICQQRCIDCKKVWNYDFGIVGTSFIGSGALKLCPFCKSDKVEGIEAMKVPMKLTNSL